MTDDASRQPAEEVSRLLHTARVGSLATVAARRIADLGASAPYVSLVMPAVDWSGAPLLLLSNLSEQARNASGDPRVALLLDGTGADREPLASARVTIMGRLVATEDAALLARYLRYQPEMQRYVELNDTRLYRLDPAVGHLAVGFGRVSWGQRDGLADDIADAQPLIDAESEILDYINRDHADALADIAVYLLGAPAGATSGDWKLLGIDPAGADFASSCLTWGRRRLRFQRRVRDREDCRAEMVLAAQEARHRANGDEA